ncbi:MAG: hypothetical protein ACXWT1_20925 [Methylobacter sp.]
MKLDAKARHKQAVKAAKVAAKNRREKNKDRDKNIVLAFDFLSGNYQPQKDRLAAFKYLSEKTNGNPNLNGQSVLRKLSDLYGIGRSGIRKIVLKSRIR